VRDGARERQRPRVSAPACVDGRGARQYGAAVAPRAGQTTGGQPPAGLILRISGLLPSLSPAEQRVGRLVVEDPERVARSTITDLAASAGTSEATVVRFCRSVGIGGYPRLRIMLAAEAARRVEPADARVVGGDIPPDADMAQIIATIAFNDARAVEETAQALDPAVCARVVDAIAAAARVDIYGATASGFVAADLQQKLHRLGSVAYFWPDPHAALSSAALLGAGDVAIGISHTGTTADVVEFLDTATRTGALTVALTNFPRSPVAEAADLVLTTAARETRWRSGATASRLAQLTVVDCLFVGVAAREGDSIRRALRVTADAVAHRKVRGRHHP
jgi:DNA-binding MurR/RpiR family transcriptional regulator